MTMAGVNNDQKMLIESDWNNPNVITSGTETIGAGWRTLVYTICQCDNTI